MKAPARFGKISVTDTITQGRDTSNLGMVFIKGGTHVMGGDNDQADKDEYPKHSVTVSSYYMDETEVTNAQFQKIVDATGYITKAERKPDWEELKKNLTSGGIAKPPDSVLIPAPLEFKSSDKAVYLHDYNQWLSWVKGACWKNPQGPESSIKGKENYPVVHVSWFDAMAYCKWVGKRLPTEAKLEYAARGGLINHIYSWGNEHINKGMPKAKTWVDSFPYYNQRSDQFITAAPVKSFEENGYGLYDMAGNVWEGCSDLYNYNYYNQDKNQVSINPVGPVMSYDPQDPYTEKRSLQGGIFLCNDAYCSGFRIARRIKSSPDGLNILVYGV